ncbi:MAG: tetratricopeptide repeat protein [Thermosulfidibacteraceae bacterium]
MRKNRGSFMVKFCVLFLILSIFISCAEDKNVNVGNFTVSESYNYKLQMAISYVVSGHFQRAISELEDLRKQKETPELYNYLGLSYMGIGSFDKALIAYKRAIELKPDYTEGYSNISACYIALGDYDKAIEYASKALSDDTYPKPEIPLTNMAQAYFGKGESEKAIELLNKAISLNPFYSVPYEILIKYYLEKDDYQRAKRYLNDAIDLEVESPGILFYRALFKLRDGDREEAKKLFKEISKNYTGTDWAAQAKVYLEVIE